MKIIFASGNEGKTNEVKKLFEDTRAEIISLKDCLNFPEIIEDGNTFEENAFIKAKHVFQKYNAPVIADDSGLCVDQLNGEPGVYSARYAGENCSYDDNNNKLIFSLKEFPEPHFAKFIACAVYLDEKDYFCATGVLEGRIINEKRGVNGFGYDPIFVPNGFSISLAEMSLKEKNLISHRSKAFNKLISILKNNKKVSI